MTNKKKIVSRILLVIVALTLISFCFIGTTLARYTSENSGTASTGVAKWAVAFTTGDATEAEGEPQTASFGNLSPAQEAYTGTQRTNSTGVKKIAEIANTGAVDAYITLTVGEETLTGPSSYSDPTADEVKALFDIKLYYATSDLSDSVESPSSDGSLKAITSGTQIGTALAATSGTFYIYGEVIWSSADAESSGDKGAAADELDTWVGENVTSVSYEISYTAVQASEQPA